MKKLKALTLLIMDFICAFTAVLAVMAFEFTNTENLRHPFLLYLLWFGKVILAAHVYTTIMNQFKRFNEY